MLSSKDFFVDADVGRAESLPASAFTSEEFLQLELRIIFARSWLLVPPQEVAGGGSKTRTDYLRTPGGRIPYSVLGRPIFLQRSSKGGLHCFPNVCTHAWHPLVESANIGGAIICPQHGRQFDDEGRFMSQQGFERGAGFPRDSDNLRKLSVEEWARFLFVCLGNPLASFQDFVKDIQHSIPGIELGKLRRHSLDVEERVVDGNWKQHAWNYMDNFHIRYVHKGPGGLADAVELASYKTELYRFSALQWVYARDPSLGFDPRLLAQRFQDPENPGRRVFALWWFIFPNLTLNFYPWGLSVNVYMPVLDRPDKTRFLWFQYALDEEKFLRRNDVWLDEQVDQEDIEAISLVSRGAGSGFAPRGRFAPREEAGPHWFHRLVYETAFEHSRM